MLVFLMFLCLGVFGVWLVRVLLVCVWLGYVLGGLQKLQSYFCGVFCVEKLRNLDLCLFGIVTFVTRDILGVCVFLLFVFVTVTSVTSVTFCVRFVVFGGCFVFGACVYSCPWVPPKH